MAKKIRKKYIYLGLGFPVQLHNVEMIKFEGKYHPKIDVKKVARNAIKALVSQESRLTGNQVKFIRNYFEMSLRKFGEEVVKESHAAVKKWEDQGEKITNMDVNIEILLRLFILDHVVLAKSQKIKFYNQYKRLSQTLTQSTPANTAALAI